MGHNELSSWICMWMKERESCTKGKEKRQVMYAGRKEVRKRVLGWVLE